LFEKKSRVLFADEEKKKSRDGFFVGGGFDCFFPLRTRPRIFSPRRSVTLLWAEC
jgi:hypothetical protein